MMAWKVWFGSKDLSWGFQIHHLTKSIELIWMDYNSLVIVVGFELHSIWTHAKHFNQILSLNPNIQSISPSEKQLHDRKNIGEDKKGFNFYLLCWRGPFLGRKLATVSTVKIPVTYPLFRIKFPSNPPNLKS